MGITSQGLWGSSEPSFDLINFESCFKDLVYNEFDLSQFEGLSKEQNKIFYKAISENLIKENDRSVEYLYNDDFFRSDNFINQHEGLHILFSGCSESEGVGDNIEHAWTKILYDKISKEIKCSGFFNLSRSGWGWSKIVTNALIYFEKYGYPELYFILLPNHQRMYKFFKEGALNDEGDKIGHWQYLQSYPSEYYAKIKPNNTNFSHETEYKENFMNFFISWKLFNKICKDNGVKLIFATWDEQDSLNIEHLKMFDNFLEMDARHLCEPFIKRYYEKNNKTIYDLKKRDGHSGRIIHNFWADRFYYFYKDVSNNV